jgi:glycosyltransferase involved in cell wall biosynthesis
VAITPFAHRDQWGYDPASIRAYRSADAVLALLETEADLYREHGVPDHTIAVSGVCAPQVPHVDQTEAQRRLGITGPLALFLGARRPYKGYELLLSAAPRIAAELPTAKLAFVGPGEPLPNANRATNILDVGPVEEGEKALWLNAASLLCLPSSAEILPSSILEAWSVGTPAVTSDIPPLRELVETSGGGVCVGRDADELGAVLIDLLGDPTRLRQLGEAGRAAWQSRFTPDRVARWHEDLYRAAVTRRLSREPQPA